MRFTIAASEITFRLPFFDLLFSEALEPPLLPKAYVGKIYSLLKP